MVEQDADKLADLNAGIERGNIVARATLVARDLVNEPANIMTPTRLAEVAHQVAQECGLDIQVLEREQMQGLGMGALLGVAAGSSQPPKLIVLKYNGDPEHPQNGIDLIGKGWSPSIAEANSELKRSRTGCGRLKGDMRGAASVMRLAVYLKALACNFKPRMVHARLVGDGEHGSAGRSGRYLRSRPHEGAAPQLPPGALSHGKGYRNVDHACPERSR